MKLLIGILSILHWLAATYQLSWMTDFDKASEESTKSNKMILLNFSGSDWCGPCIRMDREIFHSEDFNTYAQKQLVLLRADFPRMKKNQLDEEQRKKNEILASKYNPEGRFPYTILMTAKGEVLGEWIGFKPQTPQAFIAEINAVLTQNR